MKIGRDWRANFFSSVWAGLWREVEFVWTALKMMARCQQVSGLRGNGGDNENDDERDDGCDYDDDIGKNDKVRRQGHTRNKMKFVT